MATGFWCPECLELTEPVRVYECDVDGYVGEERQCETCKRFCSRRDEEGCESCFAEVDEVEVVTDHDGTLIRAEDYLPNGKALAVRRQEELKKQQKAAALKSKSKLDALIAGTTETTWGSIAPGQKVVVRDWKGNLDAEKQATVLSITEAGDNCVAPLTPGTLIVLVQHYGLRVEVHAVDEAVRIKSNSASPEAQQRPQERFVVSHGSDSHGTALKLVDASVGLAAVENRNVYIGEITGRNSEYSSFRTTIAAFFEPEEARAFAAAAREAAADLKNRVLTDGVDGLQVQLTEDDDSISSHAPTRHATFLVGTDDMMGGEGVLVATGASERTSQSFTVTSPNVLEGIAAAAERIAGKLSELIDPKV